ncbi:MAG: hypothetical protein JWN48_5338 [Myxococcaceae bacterium]|nr:hypothetical protein [Myxococcaceae bacterium]
MTQQEGLSQSQRTLLDNLTRELFQTETSADRHSNREAERLGNTPPALALRDVAAHAKSVLTELPALAERNGMVVSKGGAMTGELFSQVRDKLADMLIDSERSYRGTLLGMQHGLGVVRLLQQFAEATGKSDLAQFCTSWLTTRTVLVEKVEDELRWFAEHADEAVKIARPWSLQLRARARDNASGTADRLH